MHQIVIFISGLVVTFSMAKADEWGCQLLLCLSDPRGPTTEKECIPPMERLWRHLAKGGSFPTCALVDDMPGDLKIYLQQQQRGKQ